MNVTIDLSEAALVNLLSYRLMAGVLDRDLSDVISLAIANVATSEAMTYIADTDANQQETQDIRKMACAAIMANRHYTDTTFAQLILEHESRYSREYPDTL